jgi:hypothetical protein
MSSSPDNAGQPPGNPGAQGSPGPDHAQPSPGGSQNLPRGSGDAARTPDSTAAPSPVGSRGGHAGGRSYADAANQVGGGQLFEQNRVHNRALADLQGNQVGGDIFFGDKFELSFGQGGTRIRVRRITAEEFTEPFVRTPALDGLGASVSDQPLVVLQGPRGHGKCAALVRTLRRGLRDGAVMFYLDPLTNLATFSCAEVPEDSVLILQDLPESAADCLDTYAVERVQSELRARGCRLGITTSKAANLTTLSSGFLVLELEARPSPRQVFDRHLSELLLGTGVTRDAVLSWPDVRAMLDVQLGPDCSLADAARLATMLFRARDKPETAARRVRTQMTEYADEKVAQWFRKLDSLKAQCMAISLAVLNGLSREMIAREAQLLEARILPAPDAANAPAVTNPFGADAAISPSLLQAKVVTETGMTTHGPIVVRTMSYLEQGYPGQVLRYVWREHDDGRPALVDWLRHMGRSSDLAVQVRAATAVGVLACEAMDYIHSQIILDWACDDESVVRTSAAIALGPPASDPLVRDTVRSLVADWAKEGSLWPLRATAARTYGRSIGLNSPTLALRELARLAEIDDLALMIAISNSYCELVLDGTTPLSVRVLGEIEKLAADRTREKQIVGRLSLLGLSYLRGAPSVLNEHNSRFRLWPTLLAFGLANDRVAAAAGRLWGLSLNDPDVGSSVTESLDDWARAAEDIGELRPAFVSLMREVARDERARRAVLRRAQFWSNRNGKAPKTGHSVIEDLT